jgi:cytochrome b involved in lipid metabolism
VLAIVTFAGKDATEEFNMIHPPGVIEKYAPDVVIGVVGEGTSGGGGAAALPALPAGQNYYSMSEVAKHTTKSDCWVIINGDVLNVTKFLSEHPGGELAILTFAGKDATEEFDMIHPPGVIAKYAPDVVIGKVGEAPKAAAAAAVGGGSTKVRGSYKKYEANKKKRLEGHGKIDGWFGAVVYMVLGFLKETILTIFGQNTIQFTNDRIGLTRSAMFLFVFIIIHAIGNLHVFLGPNDFNGYGYFYVRLYPTGFGLPANIVEIYVALCALLHVMVALKRTWDMSLSQPAKTGKLNLAISGICLLTFMLIHLFQFRFGDTRPYQLCPPPYFVNLKGLLSLNLFWEESCAATDKVWVRDIYRLEFQIFQSLGWSIFYSSAVVMFTTHMCLGWAKCVSAPALDIPKRYHNKAAHMGYIMTAFIALLYLSFPAFTHIFQMPDGWSPECSWDKNTQLKAPGQYDFSPSGAKETGLPADDPCGQAAEGCGCYVPQ